MKKKVVNIIFYLLIITVTVIYTYKIRFIVDDELFNYGFAKNILDGLIPYKDFNMIIPPLFAYITALFLKIFGQKLIVYHILTAIIIFLISYLSSKKIGTSAFLIYLLLLIYPYTGYNMFSLLLFFILLTLKENDKKNFYLEPLIISLMILTKHTLGLLVIPSIIYSSKKFKTFLVYIVSFLILLLYLLINNNMFEFIDYCILGMFSFTTDNGSSINFLFILELIIIITLTYKLIKNKRKDYFYILMYQIITFPIVNYIHFMISFIPVVYLLILKNKDNFYFKWFSKVTVISFFLCFTFLFLEVGKEIGTHSYQANNFMKGRIVENGSENYIKIIDKYINKYQDYQPYIFSNLAYKTKLILNLQINKFDLINNGNMGYKGGEGYIDEIEGKCKNNKCIFFINEVEINSANDTQTSQEILLHFSKKYKKVYSSNMFNIYIN